MELCTSTLTRFFKNGYIHGWLKKKFRLWSLNLLTILEGELVTGFPTEIITISPTVRDIFHKKSQQQQLDPSTLHRKRSQNVKLRHLLKDVTVSYKFDYTRR